MKKLISLILAITLFFSMSLCTYAEDNVENEVYNNEVLELSLEKAIDYALKHSRDMTIQKLELEKTELQYEEYDGYLKRGKDEFTEDFYYALNIPPTHSLTIVNKSLMSNGAKEKNINLMLNTAKWNMQLMENKIRYDVEKAYYDLIRIKQDLGIAQEGLNLATEQYAQSKKMYDLGTISSQQLLAAEIGLNQAQGGYDSALMGYQLQIMSFNNTLDLPLTQKVELTEKVGYKHYEYIDFDAAIREAYENSAMIKAATVNRDIAKLVLRAVEDGYHNRNDKVREKEVELLRAENNLKSVKNGVELSVRSSGLNLMNYGKTIKTYTLAAQKAQKNYELTQLGFKLGNNTPNDVTQARIELMNAKKDLAKEIHAYNLAYLDFKYSTGLGKDLLR